MLLHPERYRTSGGGELNRVGEQVDQNLAQADRIPFQPVIAGMKIHLKIQPLLLRLGAHHTLQFLKQKAQRKVLLLDLHLSVLDP